MNKYESLAKEIASIAESYNIDTAVTYNETDAEYCADKLNTICQTVTTLGVPYTMDMVDGQYSKITIGKSSVDVPMYPKE